MKKTIYLVFFLCSSILISACQKEEEWVEEKVEQTKKKIAEFPFDTSLPGEEGVKNTIKAYNLAMRNALLDDRYLGVLKKYATDKETQRVYVDIEYDTLRGVAMKSWQKELVFENISVSELNGYADTSETWDFEYVDLKTREVVEPKKTIKYKLNYTLEKEGDRWVIARIEEREPSVVTKTVEIPLRRVPQ